MYSYVSLLSPYLSVTDCYAYVPARKQTMNFDIEAEQSWHDTKSIVCQEIWSAICFKIMTRYTCGFFPRILAIIPATRYTCLFLSRILAFFPALRAQTHIYMHTKKPIYMRYKQACGICGHRKSSYKRHRIIPSAKNPFMYDGAER